MQKLLPFFFLLICLFFSQVPVAAQTDYEIVQPKANVVEVTQNNHELWFATYGQGLLCYNQENSQWTSYSTAQNNLENDFFYCIAVSEDFIWAGSSDGLYIYDRKREFWKKRKFAAGGEYGNWIRALYYDAGTSTLWIGRFSFLTRLNVKKQKFDDFDLTIKKDDRTNNFKVIRPDGENTIWFGTEAGVYQYDKSKDIEDKTSLVFYSPKQNGFRGEGDYAAISEILSDQNGVWFGTEEFITHDRPQFNLGGLFKFNRRAIWQKYDKRTGFAGNGIRTLLKTGKRLWVSVYEFDKENKSEAGKGLLSMDVNTGKVLKIDLDKIKITTLNINTLTFDGKYLWLGTDSGIWKVRFTNPFAEWTAVKR